MACLVMTLEEMLKIALGTSPLEHVQVAVLHNFLKIIIEKLKIKTSFVEVSGPEAKILREMLCQAHNPLLEFTTNPNDKITGDVAVIKLEEQIQKLSSTVEKIECHLRTHLEAVERCKKPIYSKCLKIRRPKHTSKKGHSRTDSPTSSDNEDLCTSCVENNIIACDLLQNRVFLKKLMRFIASPVIDRIFQFEKVISILNENFQNFLNTAEDEYRKIPLIEDCFAQIKEVRIQLENHLAEYADAIKGINEMLDTKLDKIYMTAFEKIITDKITDIDKRLKEIENKEQCPKAAGVIMTNLQCLCCTSKVCQKDKVFNVPLLVDYKKPEKKLKNTRNTKTRFCIPDEKPRACGGSHTVIHPDEKRLYKSNLMDDFGEGMDTSHHQQNDKLVFFKGHHNKMYRQG